MTQKMNSDEAQSHSDLSRPICGIVMPISEIDGLTKDHWIDVRAIIEAAAISAGYSAKMVSEDVAPGIIQKRIVQNLYDNQVVVCDVSAKNANVMLELGMRLAFDKPVVVIKDDATSYSFDTSPIEHLEYPRDLRYQSILKFQSQLTKKLKSASLFQNGNSFLQSFGNFKVAELPKENVGSFKYIEDALGEIRKDISRILPSSHSTIDREYPDLLVQRWSVSGTEKSINEITDAMKKISGIVLVKDSLQSRFGGILTAEIRVLAENNAALNKAATIIQSGLSS